MNACSFNIGNKFQNKNTLEIVEVVVLDERKYFEGHNNGDVWESLDEDCFNDLEYYTEICR